MWLLEQQMMEIVKLGLALEPNHTVPLSLVDFPGSISGISTENLKSLFLLSISLRIAFVIQGDGFFLTLTVLTGA